MPRSERATASPKRSGTSASARVPDTMVRLSAVLPVAQGVACYAALCRAADTTCTGGDNPWARADHGRHRRRAPDGPGRPRPTVPVEIELVMTDTTLLAPAGTPGREEPALVPGYGPVPAGLARDLVLGSGASDAGPPARHGGCGACSAGPGTGELAAMETHRREFTANQRRFLRLRDQTCRTPYCDAPIRHADHVDAHVDGGPTSRGQRRRA